LLVCTFLALAFLRLAADECFSLGWTLAEPELSDFEALEVLDAGEVVLLLLLSPTISLFAFFSSAFASAFKSSSYEMRLLSSASLT
jgi:hypothetical protein